MEAARSWLGGWIEASILALSPADVLLILVGVLVISLSRYAGMWIYALVALPGTLMHELAHFLVAALLGARPSFPALLPVRTERSWRLGSVSFRAGRLRSMPIALAPLLLLPLALWWAAAFVHTASWPLYGVHVWIAAALLQASLPSKTDLKLALPALLLVALLAGAALLFWAMR